MRQSVRCVGLALLAVAAGDPGAAEFTAPHPAVDFVVPAFAPRLQLAGDLEPSPDPSVVDIGFFFARELRERGLSLTSLDATAQRMVDFNNAAFVASGIPLTLRIVYAGEYEQVLQGVDTHTAFHDFGVATVMLREGLVTEYGMDAVVLIKATDDADTLFGIAELGTTGSLTDPGNVPHALVCLGAAQTSGLECFGNGGIFAHEVGHLFGAGHQRNAPVGGSGGAFEFSYASGCGGGTIVFSPVSVAQQIYSTPAITVNNEPCGIAASAGPDGVDNTHTIDLTRALMASLRETMPIAGTVSIEGPSALILTEGGQPETIIARRDGDLAERARVSLAVVSGRAQGPDVSVDPAEVVFEPGQDAVTIQVAAIDDLAFEPEEMHVLALRNPWRLEKQAAPVTITIIDNDVAPPPPPPPAPPPRTSSGGGSMSWLSLLLLAFLCASACRAADRSGTRMQAGRKAGKSCVRFP